MSTSDAEETEFETWIVEEFAERRAFTALVILVEIGETDVRPLSSTYFAVVGDDVGWPEIAALFSGAGIAWDGAAFFAISAAGGGPLDNAAARAELGELERRVKADRLTINEGHFFDKQGRRVMVEEVPPQ
ncbi:MAG TPA: hypothetical protein VFE34_01785 [Dongiaceae bacterium]|nr:hypothetical protein [Dongiaceae bacterium]